MANPGPAKYRILKKIEPISTASIVNPHSKEPSGTRGTHKRRLSSLNPKGRVTPHRKGASYVSNKAKRTKRRLSKMDETVKIIRSIIDNHKGDVHSVIESVDDVNELSKVAKNLMKTCLGGWSRSGDMLVSSDNTLQVHSQSFDLMEDTTLRPKRGVSLNYDWLYRLASAADHIVNEEEITYGSRYQEFSIDRISDALSNASKVLKGLDDDQIKKYILEQEASEGDVNIRLLRDVLDDADKTPNWRLEKVKVEGSSVHIIIRVKYSRDGTEKGIVDKHLSIEIRPSHAVEEIEEM